MSGISLHIPSWSCGNLAHTNPDVGCPDCAEYCVDCDQSWPCETVRTHRHTEGEAMTDHYEMPHARADECPHAGVGKACRPCRDRFERTPITPDERANVLALADNLDTYPEAEAADTLRRLLDALDTAEAEVARLREKVARLSKSLSDELRPAPVWDEGTVWDEVQGAVARVVAPYTSGPMDPLDVQVTDAVLTVVREHLTVKPDPKEK